MDSVFIRKIDRARLPEVSAIKPIVIKINSFSDNESEGSINSKNFTTMSAFQVLKYLGEGG